MYIAEIITDALNKAIKDGVFVVYENCIQDTMYPAYSCLSFFVESPSLDITIKSSYTFNSLIEKKEYAERVAASDLLAQLLQMSADNTLPTPRNELMY